jgi:hypothetical protein
MIRRVLIILGTVALWLVLAAPAQAISADDCENTLRGRVGHLGFHGWEDDIKARWDKMEIERGIDIVSSQRAGAWHPNGYSNQVGMNFIFYRASGATVWHAFLCIDNRAWNQGYSDQWWYHISG